LAIYPLPDTEDKKILRKLSSNGIEVGIRNSNGEALKEGDVFGRREIKFGCKDSLLRLYRAEASNMYEMGKTCYEMGNRHAPLFIDGDELMTPYDER